MYSTLDLQKLVQMLNYLGFSGNIAPAHSVVIGGGSVAPGAAGTIFSSTGTTSDPAFQTLAALGIAPLPLPSNSVGATQIAAGAVSDASISSASKLFNRINEIFDVRDPAYGAKGDGVNDDAPAFQAAVNAANAAGGGMVLCTSGTYRFGSAVNMKSNVTVQGFGLASLTQSNGANLSAFFLFGTVSNAYIRNLSIDGNRDNNTNDLTHQLIHLQNGTDVGVIGCTLLNAPGYSIASNALRAKIIRNRISNPYGTIGIFNAAFGNTGPTSAYLKIEGNYCDGLCLGGLLLGGSDYAIVSNNHFVGVQLGGRGNRLTVNTSGTTATWASGPQFTSVKPGMFVIINGGMEFQVASVTSATQLTVTSSMPTLTGTAASIGTGDIVGIVNSSYANVSGNTVTDGVTFGMGLSLGGVSWGCSHNMIRGNKIIRSGKNGFNVSYDGGTGFLYDNQIIDNHVIDAGSSPGAGPLDLISIFLSGATTGKVESTFIDGNYCFSDSGDGQQPYWFGTDSNLNLGSVRIGANAAIGFVNAGILNDISTITLGPAWGASASVSGIVSTGRSIRFTITANGTGIGSGAASIAVQKICTVPEQAVLLDAKIQSTNGTLSAMWGEQTSSLTEWDMSYTGTPSAGLAYTVVCQG